MNSNNKIYRFIALTLALLIFVSSVGFAVDMHYCQGQLKSMNFFGKAKSCYEIADAASMKTCQHDQSIVRQKDTCSIGQKDCCQNKNFHFQCNQNQLNLAADYMIANQQLQQFVLAYLRVFFASNFTLETDLSTYIHYKPPLKSMDIPVLFQSFLL